MLSCKLYARVDLGHHTFIQVFVSEVRLLHKRLALFLLFSRSCPHCRLDLAKHSTVQFRCPKEEKTLTGAAASYEGGEPMFPVTRRLNNAKNTVSCSDLAIYNSMSTPTDDHINSKG